MKTDPMFTLEDEGTSAAELAADARAILRAEIHARHIAAGVEIGRRVMRERGLEQIKLYLPGLPS